LLGRSWDRRRIVYTKKIIAFSNVNNDAVIDVIPLHEVAGIRDTSRINAILADDTSEVNGSAGSNDDSTANSSKNVVEIETSPAGYNSGRMYQIKAKSAQHFRNIFDDLTKLSTKAREEAEAKTKFKKTQNRVGKVVNSNPVQRFFAILIFAVRICILAIAQFLSDNRDMPRDVSVSHLRTSWSTWWSRRSGTSWP
jgi:hypothetical protein